MLPSLRRKIMAHVRPTWVPVTAPGSAEPAESAFGGEPGLLAGEAWPTCKACSGPLTFFLQINLARAPGGFGTGLLQYFHCTSQDCDDSWGGGPGVYLLRIVDPARVGQLNAENPSAQFPPRRIVGWNELQDLPEEWVLSDLGLDISDTERKLMKNVPRTRDKLGGWPYLIQGPQSHPCPTCGLEMRLLFQLDSDDNLPYAWGDLGSGHIFQCPEHRESLTFTWDCC